MVEEKIKRRNYSIKTCHNCGTPLAIYSTECYSCHKKVGEVDSHGKAKKPTDWLSYVICIISWSVFFGYVYWAFF